LNNKFINIKCSKGEEVIKPYEVRKVKGLGLPKSSKNGEFGDLVIQFDVKFPDSI
jgi:DnaJ-class molecular chaperone